MWWLKFYEVNIKKNRALKNSAFRMSTAFNRPIVGGDSVLSENIKPDSDLQAPLPIRLYIAFMT